MEVRDWRASAWRRRRSRHFIGTALRAPSAPFARDGSAGRSGGGSGRGLAELLAQPVVDQTLLVAQLVAVGQRRTALQVGDIGQLARTLRKYVAIGADELEVQGDARRVDIAHEADRIGVDAAPRLVVAGARAVGDRDLEPLAVGQPVAGALAQVLGQIVPHVAAALFAAVPVAADLRELCRIGPAPSPPADLRR